MEELIDNPKGFYDKYVRECETMYKTVCILGRPAHEVHECVEKKSDWRIKVPITWLIRFMRHDWCTQRFSEKRKHTSKGCLEVLRAVADCAVGEKAGHLAELHVALDIASKLRLYEYDDVERFLEEIGYLGLDGEVKEFLRRNWQWIRADVVRAKNR